MLFLHLSFSMSTGALAGAWVGGACGAWGARIPLKTRYFVAFSYRGCKAMFMVAAPDLQEDR